jgi:hypothetical protein
MAEAPSADVEEWLARPPDDSPDRRALNCALLGKVRERGYSLLTGTPEVLQRHDALLTAFELSDRLPRQERAVRQATAELAAHFTPDVVAGHRYDVATIVVLVPTKAGLPPTALRMTGLPQDAPAEQVEACIHSLKRVAAGAEPVLA